MTEGSAGPEPIEGSADSGERLKPLATRRDFLVGTAGTVAATAVPGGVSAAQQPIGVLSGANARR